MAGVEMDGQARVLAILDALSSPLYLVAAHDRIGALLVAYMHVYPPELPNQQYRRTGNLGHRWTHVVRRDLFGIQTIVGNNTPYGPQVQDPVEQADIHRGRWRTTADAIQANQDKVVDELVQTVVSEIKRHG